MVCRRLPAAILVVLGVFAVSSAEEPEPASSSHDAILGTWDLVIKTPMEPLRSVFTFAIEGGELTGRDSLAGPATDVSFTDGVISFTLEADGRTYRVEAEVADDTLDGKVFVVGESFCNFDEMYMLEGTRRPPLEGDRAAIVEVINRWSEAAAAKDLDAMMAVFSESYRDDILESKAEMREYWGLAISNGMTEGMTIRFDPSDITITDDTAKTGRVYYQAKPGGFYQVMELKKEGGVWRITKSYS